MARTTIPAELVAVNAIQGTLIADNAITAVHIATNAVSGTLVADNAITSTHIAQNNVTATQIAQNTITVTQIADSAIETAKINNGAVTQAKIADDAIGPNQLAENAVVSASIANGTIVEADMADNAVTLAKMAGLARGKIIVGDSAGDPSALAIGSNGTVLKSDGTDVSWGTVAGGVDGISTSADATAITIDSSERIGMPVIGQTHPVGGQAKLGINADTAAGASLSIHRHYDGVFGGYLVFQKSRNTDITNLGVVSNNDILGSIEFTGADGNSYAQGAHIRALVDGTPGDGDMPTRLTFSTSADGSGVPTERMRITSAGNVGIGTSSPSTELHVYSADQNALKIQTNTAINQIDLSNSTNSPTYITANSYALELKADDNGWGGTASAIKFNVKGAEKARVTPDGVAMGDTDGDYTHRGATGGLHIKRGGLLMNGPPGNANMSSDTNGNQWTYHGQGGRGGNFTSLTISVPNPNNGASGVGYGGFSLEFYIAGYNAKYHSGHFAGYVNASIVLSKRAFWDSSGSGTLTSGSVGAQGFYLTIGFPSMTHPTCKFVINKGGHGGSAGNAAWTDIDGVSVTWA